MLWSDLFCDGLVVSTAPAVELGSVGGGLGPPEVPETRSSRGSLESDHMWGVFLK